MKSIFFEDGRNCIVCGRRALFFTYFDLQEEPRWEKPFCTPGCIDEFYEQRKERIAQPRIHPTSGGEALTDKLRVVYAPIPCGIPDSWKEWLALAKEYGLEGWVKTISEAL